jgi:FkbM family methyltransferase
MNLQEWEFGSQRAGLETHAKASRGAGATRSFLSGKSRITLLGTRKLDALRKIVTFDNWPMLILARVFDRKTGFVVYRKNGMDILVDYRGGDENGVRECIASVMYRRYLPSLVLPGPVRVLDLGANGGGFPLMLALAGVQVGQVVCVEMNPLTCTRLQVNLATNLGDAAFAINAAVCGLPVGSEILLNPSRGSTSYSMYTEQAGSSTPHVSIRTTTLQALYDQYFANEFVDICKIDIESAEYDLIAASSDDLLRKIKYLFIEFHDAARTPALLQRLIELGFVQIAVQDGHETEAFGDVRAFRGPKAENPSK